MAHDWLFAEVEDVPLHQNTIGHRWRTTLRRAGVTDVRPHDSRMNGISTAGANWSTAAGSPACIGC